MSIALIIVDVQVDFCEDGLLAVAGGYDIARRIKYYVRNWGVTYDTIVASQDWHNADGDNGGHFSLFPDFVNSWPVHCVAGTPGAELVDDIAALPISEYFRKGQGKPDYSAFQGVSASEGISLDQYLHEHKITAVDVCGIAGDHCVKATAVDAVNHHYTARILPDLVASVGGAEATIAAIQEVDNLR